MTHRMTMASLSFLAAVFLAKEFHKPVASFVAKPSTAVRCSFRRLATDRYVSSSGYLCRNRHQGSRYFSSAPLAVSSSDITEPQSTIPITLLSGFLGSGKTSTLQHLLENKDGLEIGVIVNDVASVNIDAKLIKKSDSDTMPSQKNLVTRSDGIIELQNGCACCSLADELVPTVESLLQTKNNFDAIVIELSGVGDPIAVQQLWKQSKAKGHPVTKIADMKRIVTLIDSSTFGTDWMTW